MANPTRTQISTEFSTIITNNTPSTGSASDEQINALIGAMFDYFNNLDPDRPVKVKNLQRHSG